MEAQDLILADYADVNPGGKFTLVGAGFTRIGTKQIPCIHKLMFLFVRLKITSQDRGKNRIEIRIVSEKGNIFKTAIDLDVSQDHSGEKFIPTAIKLDNLSFQYAGDYTIEVVVNGQLLSSQILKIDLQNSQKVG